MTIEPLRFPKWKEEAIEAVSKDGLNLTPFWATDRDVVTCAILNNPFAIRKAVKFQNDKRIAKLAVTLNGLAIFWLSEDLQKNRKIKRLSRKHLPRIYKGPSTPYFQNRTVFFITSGECAPLEALRSYSDIFDKISFLILSADRCSSFLRDSRVTLFRDSHLITHPIYDTFYRDIVRTLLPKSAEHNLIKPLTQELASLGVGRGYYIENVHQAMIHSYGIKAYKMGRSCVEGGNAFLFLVKTRQVALVGEMSIVLTMATLDEQGYFDSITLDSNIIPTEDSYRVARNVELYFSYRRPIEERLARESNKLKCDDVDLAHFGGELGYRELLTKPVLPADKPRLKLKAQQVEHRKQIAREMIAKDLEIALENIAFLPQKLFHLDLDVLVTPNGEVILHDDDSAFLFLENIKNTTQLARLEYLLITEFQKKALRNSRIFSEANKTRRAILDEKKIPYRLMPLVFKAKIYKSHLNYCNGVFLRMANPIKLGGKIIGKTPSDRFAFITTGTSFSEEKIVHNRIKFLFETTFSKYELRGVPNMSEFIAKRKGGIRCLSFESSVALDFT